MQIIRPIAELHDVRRKGGWTCAMEEEISRLRLPAIRFARGITPDRFHGAPQRFKMRCVIAARQAATSSGPSPSSPGSVLVPPAAMR